MSYRSGMLVLAALATAVLGGCSTLGVKPWQRDILSRQDMQLGNNNLEEGFDAHMYFSKEASSGGKSYAGGGCGCN